MYAKSITSSCFSFTLRGNEVDLPGLTSLASASMYSTAPYSRQIRPGLRTRLRYAVRFSPGTGTTKPLI